MIYHIKEITYFCGCKITLNDWVKKDAPLACDTHLRGIQKIVETTVFEEKK